LVEIVGWGNLKGNSFNLINWDVNVLGEFIEFISVLDFGSNEVFSNWGWLGNNWGLGLFN